VPAVLPHWPWWYDERTRWNIIDHKEPDLGTIKRFHHRLFICERAQRERKKERNGGWGVPERRNSFFAYERTSKQTQQQKAALDNFSVVEVIPID